MYHAHTGWPCTSIYGDCNASHPRYHEHIPLPYPKGYRRWYRSSSKGVSFIGDKEHTQDDLPKNALVVNTAEGRIEAWMFNSTVPFAMTSAASTDGV